MLSDTRSKDDQTVVKTSPGEPDRLDIITRDISVKIKDSARMEYLKMENHRME